MGAGGRADFYAHRANGLLSHGLLGNPFGCGAVKRLCAVRQSLTGYRGLDFDSRERSLCLRWSFWRLGKRQWRSIWLNISALWLKRLQQNILERRLYSLRRWRNFRERQPGYRILHCPWRRIARWQFARGLHRVDSSICRLGLWLADMDYKGNPESC